MKHPIHTAAPIPSSAPSPTIPRIPRLARALSSPWAFRSGLKSVLGSALLVSACLGGSQGFLFAQVDEETVTTTETTTSAGTISEFEPDSIVIRTERSTEPLRYSYSRSTAFVDENGTPVSMAVVKSGLPVTVYYAREGDRLVASKVIVRRTTEPAEPERVIEKKTTTTTTDK